MHLVCTHYEIDILSVAVYMKTLRLKEGESFFFLPRPAACGILVPQPGMAPGLPAVEA